MSNAARYGEWLIANSSKKGSPEFDKVAGAYKAAREEEASSPEELVQDHPAAEPVIDRNARAEAEKEMESSTEGVKAAETKTERLETLSNTLSSLASGGIALAGLPMKTIADTVDLGKAVIGSGYMYATGDTAPKFLELRPREEITGTPENIAGLVAPKGLPRQGDSMKQKLIYGVGGSIIPAIATKNLGGLAMSAPKALAYGAGAGAGSVLGGETAKGGGETAETIGSIVGGIAAPVSIAGVARAATATGGAIKDYASHSLKPAEDIGATMAADKLKESMVRAGQTPQQAHSEMVERGDKALLADTSPTLSSLLGVAGRANPKVAGEARAKLAERHEGQQERLSNAVTNGNMSLDDAISRIETEAAPKIAQLYDQAKREMTPYNNGIPQSIARFLEGETSITKIGKKVDQLLIDSRAAGLSATPFDRINATKQVMDDEITNLYGKGLDNEARVKVALKNAFLDAADNALPSFKEARNVFAGKEQLKEAGKNGELIFKMPVSDIKAYVQGLGDSEKAIHILGGQKAALQRIEDAPIPSDAAKKIFGRNGDIERMKILFPDEAAYNKFRSTLKNEADFLLTKREFEGTQTAERIARDAQGQITVNPLGLAKKLHEALGREKSEKAIGIAYEKLGDLLTNPNLTEAELMSFLNKAKKEIPEKEPLLKRVGQKVVQSATISQLASEPKEKKEK